MGESTYAKLYTLPTINPKTEQIMFTLELSENLGWDNARIRIFSDYIDWTGEDSFYEQVFPINSYVDNLRLYYLTIPAHTLNLPYDNNFWTVHNYTAQVEISDYVTNKPKCYSNIINLDLIKSLNFQIVYDINCISAKKDISIIYDSYYYGHSPKKYINSYSVELYDTENNLISTSGEMTDWNSSANIGHTYTFKNLKNNTTYFFKVNTTSMNGYTQSTELLPLNVVYDVPTISPLIVLTNDSFEGCVNVDLTVPIDITATNYQLSRSKIYEENFVVLKSGTIPVSKEIKFSDYYAIPNVTYVYKLILLNNNSVVSEYANTIQHTFKGICICDKNNHFSSILEFNILPLTKNIKNNVIVTTGNKMPFVISNGNSNFYSGKVSGLFVGKKENATCEDSFDFDNATAYRYDFMEFITDKKPKILKWYNGSAYIISVTGNPSIEDGGDDKTHSCNFEFTEIKDINEIDNYYELGLI